VLEIPHAILIQNDALNRKIIGLLRRFLLRHSIWKQCQREKDQRILRRHHAGILTFGAAEGKGFPDAAG
jgi:hypothetical protein